MNRSFVFVSLFLVVLVTFVQAPVVVATPIEDVVRETILRLKEECPAEELLSITPNGVVALLTPQERTALAEQYLTFRVNVPVTVFVATEPELTDDAFWLESRGFRMTELVVQVNDERRLVSRKDFPAGQIGLGVNSLTDDGDHYFAIIVARDGGAALSVADITPAIHTLGVAEKGDYVLADEDDELIVALPDELKGHVLLRGYGEREEEAFIAGFFRQTSYPATEQPSQIVVTMSEDPSTSMTVQWSTSTAVSKGAVRYQEKALHNLFRPAKPRRAVAETVPVEDIGLIADSVIHRHFATLSDLEPGTMYVYSVGDGSRKNWSELREFSTAPAETAAFSFLYMGDIQIGYDRWASVKRRAVQMCPDAAFCLTAGDQVNRGGYRNDWDAFFHYADNVFAALPLVPTVGNHDVFKGEPGLYLELLDLPQNGPSNITPERAYAFEYGHVLVVSLDANLPPEEQVAWLEEQLASSGAVWKFVLFHQPAYSSKPNRDNPKIREIWGAVFDKYGVDIAFQGHDHGYLRTFPMKGGIPAEQPGRGTVYLVTVAGIKMYDVAARDYGEFVVERTPTFQVIDILVSPHRLLYRACDVDGNKIDEFTIVK